MTQLSARFTQAPSEIKRYLLDWSAQLSTGETVVGIATTVTTLTTPTGGSAPLTATGVVIFPDGQHATVFIAGGADTNQYEVTFLATTSIGQVFEDVIEVDITEKA